MANKAKNELCAIHLEEGVVEVASSDGAQVSGVGFLSEHPRRIRTSSSFALAQRLPAPPVGRILREVALFQKLDDLCAVASIRICCNISSRGQFIA